MNLTLPVSGAWRTTAIDLGQWLPGGSADGRNRRTSPVAEPLGEGLLTEATAVARPGTRELVFLLRVFGRLPITDVTRYSEAGVRKASGEETAGEFAPALVSIYGE